jgi:NADH dehydrogenase FAD-containing subunit
MPGTGHNNLITSGLGDSQGFLDVDKHTLQHKKYDNVFGVGDVNNVPTTKTFYGGLNQVAVVRNNIERRLNGLSLNARYDGFAEAPLFLSRHNITWASHKYDGEEVSFDTSSITSSLKYKIHSHFGAS